MDTSFFSTVLQIISPAYFPFLLLGTIWGLIVGVIPGLGSIQGIVLLLPLTFTMNPSVALVLLTSVYCASVFGGSIAAILFRIPGTESSVMTTIDGYELTKKGYAGKALGTAMFCSAFGGIFSTFVLQMLAPFLADIALKFGPSEYFALGLLGLSCVSSVGTKSQIKALISTMLGLFLATIGIDPISGVSRFTFGIEILQTGVSFTPAIIGMFAVGELLNQLDRPREVLEHSRLTNVKVSFLTLSEFLQMKWLILRSAITGTWVGILPGVGGSTAAVIAYNQELRLSSKKDAWGTGIIEGVAAPETSNNASVGGAMVPLLGLGIPGSSTTAVLIGAFLIHGLRPGPLLFMSNPEVVNSIIVSMYFVNLVMILLAFFSIKYIIKILSVPYPILASLIFIICITGAIVLGGFSNVWTLLLFGILGFLLSKFGFPLSPVVIALILGPLMEASLRRAIYMSDIGFLGLFTRPITIVLMVMTIVSFAYPYMSLICKRRKSLL